MEKNLIDWDEIIHKRNVFLYWLFLGGLFVDIIVCLLIGEPLSLIGPIIGAFVFFGVVFGLIIKRKRWIKGTMHSFSFLFFSFVFYLVLYDPHPINLFFLFLAIVFSFLYQNRLNIVLSFFYSVLVFNITYLLKADLIFVDASNINLIFYNFLLLCLALCGYINAHFNEQKTIETELQKVDLYMLKNQAEESLKSIQNNANNMVAFSHLLSNKMEEMNHHASVVQHSMTEMDESFQVQTENTIHIAESIQSLNRDVSIVSTSTKDGTVLSNQIAQEVTKGEQKIQSLESEFGEVGSIMGEMTILMNDLEISNKTITNTVDVIRDISEQTNLLALNASIEAARAGAAGKGFSVVAAEVKKLAEHSRIRADEVSAILDGLRAQLQRIGQQVNNGEHAVNRSNEAMKEVTDIFSGVLHHTQEMDEMNEKIHQSIQNLIRTSEDIVEEIESIANITEENAGSITTISSAIHDQNRQMVDILKQFKELENRTKDL